MESLAFLLIYFLKGSLPWQGIKAKVKAEKYARIGEVKKNTTSEELCQGISSKDWPNLEKMLLFLNYVRSLDFTDKPDYNYLRSLLETKSPIDSPQLDWQ